MTSEEKGPSPATFEGESQGKTTQGSEESKPITMKELFDQVMKCKEDGVKAWEQTRKSVFEFTDAVIDTKKKIENFPSTLKKYDKQMIIETKKMEANYPYITSMYRTHVVAITSIATVGVYYACRKIYLPRKLALFKAGLACLASSGIYGLIVHSDP
jgi:hypothetical protein